MGKSILAITALAVITLTLASFTQRKPNQDPSVKNIVLVHGAFVDGSGWEPVYKNSGKKGYNVSITQHSLQSLATDIAAVNRVIDQQNGPVYRSGTVTVASSYPKRVIVVKSQGLFTLPPMHLRLTKNVASCLKGIHLRIAR